MTSIRKFVYASLLALTALSIVPTTATAEEPAQGKFTLTHEVRWGNALVPAGEYSFRYDPLTAPLLTLTKLSGPRTGFMLLVPVADPSKGTDSNKIVIEKSADGSYVSAMEIAECGMTLHFAAPPRMARQMAKAVPAAGPSGR